MSNQTISRTKLGASSLEGGLFAYLFTVLTGVFRFNPLKKEMLEIIVPKLGPLAKLGTHILFPIAAGLGLVKLMATIGEFYQAKNKHMGKVAHLLVEVASTATVSVAIFAPLLGLVIPSTFVLGVTVGAGAWFFTAALGLSFLYNLSMLGISIYKYATAQDDGIKQHYLADIKARGLGSLFSGVPLAAVLAIFVFPVVLGPIGVGIVGLAAAAVGLFSIGLGIHQYFKNRASAKSADKVPLLINNKDLDKPKASDMQDVPAAEIKFQPQKDKGDFYFVQNRVRLLTGNEATDRNFLMQQITFKIAEIDAQRNGSLAFFEETKRLAKISLLSAARTLLAKEEELPQVMLQPHFVSKDTLSADNVRSITELEKSQRYSAKFAHAAQSFFKNTSDFDDLWQAIKEFANKGESPQEVSNLSLAL